jgi:hypothetical protein
VNEEALIIIMLGQPREMGLRAHTREYIHPKAGRLWRVRIEFSSTKSLWKARSSCMFENESGRQCYLLPVGGEFAVV